MDLITVAKDGEPDLDVLADHLPQYEKLGWHLVQPDEKQAKAKGRKTTQGE